MGRISVVLSDWQVLFREGIHFTLSGEEDIDVIAEATSGEEALSFIESNPPQVAVLNANHDRPSGIEVTRRIRQNLPIVSVVLVMDSEDEGQLFSAIKSGASACLTKDIDPDDLIDIIIKVAQGSHPISEALLKPEIAARVLDEFEASALISQQVANLLARLTPREGETLRHIADRRTREQVAEMLGISGEAVGYHLELILHKLVSNEHDREILETAQSGWLPIARATLAGRPAAEYITKDEFATFKESLREQFKTFIGQLS